MSGVKRLVLADTKGMKPITNEMIAEEASECMDCAEEVEEQAKPEK